MKGKRNFKQQSGHLDKTSIRYRPSHEPKFMDVWMRGLSDIEPLAMSLIRPFDIRAIEPIARKAQSGQERLICTYFRVMLSSEDQNAWVKGIGRGSEWMLFDRASGCFLGLWAHMDAATPWGPFSAWAGGKVGVDARRDGANTSHMVTALKRCLPMWDFGPLTGGKLLALIATSTEMIQAHELQYSLNVGALIIKTTHGKSSQYNRLHPRGILDMGVVADGAGFYLLQTYENSKAMLLDPSVAAGKRLTFALADQVAYWKQRWLPNRLAMTDHGWVRPDPARYRLSDVIRDKIEQRIRNERQANEPRTNKDVNHAGDDQES